MTPNLFDTGPSSPAVENYDYHTLTVVRRAGEGDPPEVRVECEGAEKDDCACSPSACQVEMLIATVGDWDIMRSDEDIELVKLDARIDWSDPEEPWLDVKLP